VLSIDTTRYLLALFRKSHDREIHQLLHLCASSSSLAIHAALHPSPPYLSLSYSLPFASFVCCSRKLSFHRARRTMYTRSFQ